MKRVAWQDENGLKHAALIRDTDSDSIAYSGQGLPMDPPDVSDLDCAALLTKLHNQLLDRGLITSQDVIAAQNGLSGAILSVFKPELLRLYRGG